MQNFEFLSDKSNVDWMCTWIRGSWGGDDDSNSKSSVGLGICAVGK